MCTMGCRNPLILLTCLAQTRSRMHVFCCYIYGVPTPWVEEAFTSLWCVWYMQSILSLGCFRKSRIRSSQNHRAPCLQSPERSLHFRNGPHLHPVRRQLQGELKGPHSIPRGIRNLSVRTEQQHSGPELRVFIDHCRRPLYAEVLEGGVCVGGCVDRDAAQALGKATLLLMAHSEAEEQPIEVRVVPPTQWRDVQPATPAYWRSLSVSSAATHRWAIAPQCIEQF